MLPFAIFVAHSERHSALGKIRLLYWCGQEFKGFSTGAMWDEARFGLTHLWDFSKIAVGSAIQWLRQPVKFFGAFIPAPRQIVAEVMSAAPDLTTGYFEQFEFYRNRKFKRRLINRLAEAGLPCLSAVAQAS